LEWISHSKLKQLKLLFWVRSISVGLVANFGLLVPGAPNHQITNVIINLQICKYLAGGFNPCNLKHMSQIRSFPQIGVKTIGFSMGGVDFLSI